MMELTVTKHVHISPQPSQHCHVDNGGSRTARLEARAGASGAHHGT